LNNEEHAVATDVSWTTDRYLHDAVEYRLECESDVNPSEVHVTAADDVIILRGFVRSYAEKLAAERAAKHVYGVRVVANEILVSPETDRTDTEIARDALKALRAQTYVPNEIRVTVTDGLITLDGTVERRFQRDAAEASVTYLKGVRGLANEITVNGCSKVVPA